MLTETETSIVAPAPATFDELLETAAPSSRSAQYVTLTRNPKSGWAFQLTAAGEIAHAAYLRAFRMAEDNGPMDSEVVAIMAELENTWPAHPGVVENNVNDAVETHESEKALEAATSAVADWMSLVKKAGVTKPTDLATVTPAQHLFVQLLANYEFALERAKRLDEALTVGLLSREIDPSDPENLLSSIIGLYIRLARPMDALRALEPLEDSLAPYVLYGRALAYYAAQQPENAAGAIQTALRHWPAVAQALTREWKGGTPMPKPGEAVSELQVLFGYFEVFGAVWQSVAGSIEWLRTEEKQFQRAGAKPSRYIGLTRSGLRADSQGNVVTAAPAQSEEAKKKEQEDLIRKGQLIGEDDFTQFLEVRPNEYVYELKDRGRELQEELQEVYRRDMKLGERIEAIKQMLVEWPGHADAAVALARYFGGKERFETAMDTLQPSIFDLQKFWPDDLVGNGRIDGDWPGNKPLLTAYAYMVVDCAEGGEVESAKEFAADYLLLNPNDNVGVRQRAIELSIDQGEYDDALRMIEEAFDPLAAYNLFGTALTHFAQGMKDVAETDLKAAIESRPKVFKEMISDKHRMPHNYNPSFVHYFSAEEAYNYQQTWGGLWMRKHGALAWLRKEGRKYLPTA